MTKTPEPVDMSPRAVARRLDEVRALCRLVRYLGQFQPDGVAKAAQDAVAGRPAK